MILNQIVERNSDSSKCKRGEEFHVISLKYVKTEWIDVNVPFTVLFAKT